jgi:hypothetical protein
LLSLSEVNGNQRIFERESRKKLRGSREKVKKEKTMEFISISGQSDY